MGRRARELTPLALGLLLTIPMASAAYGLAHVEAVKTVHFPSGARVEFDSPVVLVNSTALREVSLTAERATVSIFEWTYGGTSPVGVVMLLADQRSWDADDLTMKMRATEDGGFVGVIPSGGSSSLFEPSQSFSTEYRQSPELKTADVVAEDPESPALPIFFRAFEGDFVYTRSPGTVTYSGPGVIKFLGPDVTLTTAKNSTAISTGRTPAGPAAYTLRWVYVEFEAATLRLASPVKPIELVSSAARNVEWEGAASLVAASGNVTLEGERHWFQGPVSISGELRAQVHPIPNTDRLRVTVEGKLAPLALGSSIPAPSPRFGDSRLFIVTLGLVAAAGAVAGALGWKQWRSREPPMTEAECLEWAAFLEERGDEHGALECLGVARQLAGKATFDVLQWEASCLEMLGRLDDAIEKLEQALAADPTPHEAVEASIGIAILASQAEEPSKALPHLRLALMADPTGTLSYIQEMGYAKGEDPFANLRHLPEFRQLLREARRWARAADREG